MGGVWRTVEHNARPISPLYDKASQLSGTSRTLAVMDDAQEAETRSAPPFEGTAVSGFNEKFVKEAHALRDELSCSSSFDVMFLAFLRAHEQFGYFRLGPVVIDVSHVESAVRRSKDWTRSDSPAFSRLLMDEWKMSGRAKLDELHFLYAFMRCDHGVAARVFGELAITPEAVESWLKRPPPASTDSDLLTPEDVAEYLKVHVETVRLWIRSGRLTAYRLGGLRALRIRRADVDALLLPIESSGAQPPTEEFAHADVPD